MKSDLSKVEVGDEIFVVQQGWVEVLDKDEDFVYIKDGIRFPFDGFYCETHAHASAFTEYPFIGAEEIEKDTLVYYRDNEEEAWRMGYYSHFKDGRHFVFCDSRKESETDDTASWHIVKTKNPLK